VPRPLIGLTATRVNNRYGFLSSEVKEAYTQAVINAGGIPVIVPLGLPASTLKDTLGRLDGVLLTGGGDIAPERYGSHPHPLVAEVDKGRDQEEIQVFQDAVQAGLPVLGICRGLQVVNVALGGTLYEDILDQRPGAIQHEYSLKKPRTYLAHTVHLNGSGRLASILGGPEIQVNSLHHQGIRRLAQGLQASAYAPDDLVEAVELPGPGFVLAVQWHPEWMQDDPGMRRLFAEFVASASEFMRREV
jgi:putative glutamine amidotransferase